MPVVTATVLIPAMEYAIKTNFSGIHDDLIGIHYIGPLKNQGDYYGYHYEGHDGIYKLKFQGKY